MIVLGVIFTLLGASLLLVFALDRLFGFLRPAMKTA
jgi:uncharacterized iron-regulated membrane protein